MPRSRVQLFFIFNKQNVTFHFKACHNFVEKGMSDDEIMMLPDWNQALGQLVCDFKKYKRKRDPSEAEIKNLSEILINRHRALGYLLYRNMVGLG